MGMLGSELQLDEMLALARPGESLGNQSREPGPEQRIHNPYWSLPR